MYLIKTMLLLKINRGGNSVSGQICTLETNVDTREEFNDGQIKQ
jgi:hypothetical protein